MPRITRSALFKRQLIEITASYRTRAGSKIALKFVEQIDAGIRFIATKPLACAVHTRLEGKEFRKWGLQDFPVSIFFRLKGGDTIVARSPLRPPNEYCGSTSQGHRLRPRLPPDLVPQIKAHLTPGGTVILSGLLAGQEPLVLSAYRMQGLPLVRRVTVEGWRTLVLKRRTP